MKKYFFIQDESSHWYMVPIELRERWDEIYPISDEDQSSYDLFDKEFGQFRTGGGISDIEFYVDL